MIKSIIDQIILHLVFGITQGKENQDICPRQGTQMFETTATVAYSW